MQITAFDLAQRFVGIRELAGADVNHPLIQWWLSLCHLPLTVDDETAWCSAFVNGIAWELGLPRSGSAAARSWLSVGRALHLDEAKAAYDVVVLSRGTGVQPGPDVLAAPGHVGFFAGAGEAPRGDMVQLLAGNQGNQVCVAPFPVNRVLGIRRLTEG